MGAGSIKGMMIWGKKPAVGSSNLSFWMNKPKFFISTLKAFRGDAAQKGNDLFILIFHI